MEQNHQLIEQTIKFSAYEILQANKTFLIWTNSLKYQKLSLVTYKTMQTNYVTTFKYTCPCIPVPKDKKWALSIFRLISAKCPIRSTFK